MTTSAGPPQVSVCIANFNGAAFIAECVNSVLAQVDAPSYEIIVHDDASTDESRELLAAMPHLRLLASERNLGYCASNNRMAAIARGDYLLFLNNDAALFPDALRVLMRRAQQAAVDAVLGLPQYEYGSGSLLDRGSQLDPFLNCIPILDHRDRPVAMVPGACLWISKALWQRIGGFPEWMGSIAEDLYLCCFARAMGHPVIVPRESGFRHRVGSSFGGGRVDGGRLRTTILRRRLSERNRTFVLFMFTPALMLPFVMLAQVLALVLEGVLAAALLRNARILPEVYLNAISSLWLERRPLVAHRRRISRMRTAPFRDFVRPIRPKLQKLSLLLSHGIPRIR